MVVPASVTELSEIVRASERIRVQGTGSHGAWLPPVGAAETVVSTAALAGLVELSADDQVVVAKAGTPISQLQAELASSAQCLPWATTAPFGPEDPTLGGAIAMNLPHRLEGRCGTWRDWILGVTVVTADGTVAKAGSRAVKNVAGYDLHRFMVGSMGVLGVIVEVILRTYPIRSLPGTEGAMAEGDASELWIQRVLPTDFERAQRAHVGPGVDLESTSTVIRGAAGPRYEHDWARHMSPQHRFLDSVPQGERPIHEHAKGLFDPTGKFNREVF